MWEDFKFYKSILPYKNTIKIPTSRLHIVKDLCPVLITNIYFLCNTKFSIFIAEAVSVRCAVVQIEFTLIMVFKLICSWASAEDRHHDWVIIISRIMLLTLNGFQI